MDKNQDNIDIFSDQNVVLRDLVERYVSNWKWFVLGAAITLTSAFLYLRNVSPLFQVTSSIIIKDDSSSGAMSELAVFEDMGMMTSKPSKAENEMEVIKSRSFLTNVVKDLELNVRFYKKGKTFIEDVTSGFSSDPRDREIYINRPINIDFLENDSIILNRSAVFEITLLSPEKYNFKQFESEKKNLDYGINISTSVGDIILTPNLDVIDKYLNKTIIIKLSPVNSAVGFLKSNIKISLLKGTDIINFGIRTENKEKGIDILDHLIMHYNNDALNEKSLISKNTSDFINNRLKVISDELSDVESDIENFRRTNNIVDIGSQTGLNLQNESLNEQKINDVSTQLDLVDAMGEYINEQDGINILPENLGFSDPTLTSTMSKHNELVFRRNELLKSVNEKHPAIVNLDEQINGIKSNISQNIGSIKNSYQITIDGLKKQDAILNSKLFSAPKKERELLDITRQQNVKQTLYLYLLQKREEMAISLGITSANIKIIDKAYSSGNPVSPKKPVIMVGALFLGLLLPFMVLYVSEIIDTKIHERSDVEKVLSLPIIGDIPYTIKKKRIVEKVDRSGTAEAFRLIRTNLDFLLKTNESKSNTIMITSTVGNEGKTFVAANLARTIAFSGSKVLLLGLDLRAPSVAKTLKLKKGIGVTNFITDKNLSVDDITSKYPNDENLDLITSGIIPPNPAELLMSERLAQLFKEVKDKYDYIIVDTPPVSLVTDTLLLNKFSDRFVYVVRAEFLDKRMLKIPHNLNSENKLKNLTLLVNGIRTKNNNYGYGYGYGVNAEKKWYKKMFS
ncbi:GumC family protein [Urechidicola croceus]|uniref:non-specific protein-tyrosine kinase n=1 Tax=Urechidicola croceus TaxID=1850246 RepID=A0A1D8P6A8_9FLAO|nr:tyrosine-protein kinase [Urechidicola croceus]AOW20087.1 hypothetical protein LPB138_05060 [Urechidicola croceus]